MTRPSSAPGITHEFGQRPPGQEPPRVLPPDKGKQKETSVVFPPKSTTPVAPPVIHIHHPMPDIIKNSVVIQPHTTPPSATWLGPPQAPRGRLVSFSQTNPLQPPVPADSRQAAQVPQLTPFAPETLNPVSSPAPVATSGGPPPRTDPAPPPPSSRAHRVLTPPVVMLTGPSSRVAMLIKYLATTNLGRPLVRGLLVRLSPVLQGKMQSPPPPVFQPTSQPVPAAYQQQDTQYIPNPNAQSASLAFVWMAPAQPMAPPNPPKLAPGDRPRASLWEDPTHPALFALSQVSAMTTPALAGMSERRATR